MKRLQLPGLLALMAATALGRPIPLNEGVRLFPPAPYDGRAAVIDGDSLFMGAYTENEMAVLLFRRTSSGEWNYIRKLVSVPNPDFSDPGPALAAEGGLMAAVVNWRTLYVFERSGSDWVQREVTPPAEPLGSASVAIDAKRVLAGVSRCDGSSVVFERDASGAWSVSGNLPGAPACTAPHTHSSGDLSGSFAILPQLGPAPRWHVKFYEHVPGAFEWRNFGSSSASGDLGFGSHVAADGRALFVGSTRTPYVFEIDDNGAPLNNGRLLQLGATRIDFMYELKARDGMALVGVVAPDNRGTELNVFRRNAAGSFEHVAIAHDTRNTVLYTPDVNGRTLIARSYDENQRLFVAFFELPESFATPAPLSDNFEGGFTGSWNTIPGSQLRVVPSGNSRVYSQASIAGDSGATLEGIDWVNQAVQADITPVAFDGADRWVGLVSRWTDARNHYYVTLRSSNRLVLRKVVDGVVSELASAPVTVTPGRTYRVRLETRDAEITASANRQTLLRAVDRSLARGSAGFKGYRARYDVDNVLLSPLATTLYVTDFLTTNHGPWQTRGGTWTWNVANGDFRQSSAASEAHANIGEATDSQIVLARTRIDSFSGATTAGWVGLLARYRDIHNFYSLALRSNGQIQIRKEVDGVVTVLRGRQFAASPGLFYDLRLDVIGNELRAYVDGVLQLEASDSSLPSGRAGLGMYRATASYTDYEAYQP